MYAVKQKLVESIKRGVPGFGQLSALMVIPLRLEEAKNEDVVYQEIMAQLEVESPDHQGASLEQEKYLIIGELIGNLSLAVPAFFFIFKNWGIEAGILSAFVAGFCGNFLGCQLAYSFFSSARGRDNEALVEQGEVANSDSAPVVPPSAPPE